MPPEQPAADVDQSLDVRPRNDVLVVEDLAIDASTVAPRLGLTPRAFMAAIGQGAVSQITERGTDEDAGRYRVTFRFRRRTCRLIVTSATGAVVPA